jgi:hypothetical protein
MQAELLVSKINLSSFLAVLTEVVKKSQNLVNTVCEQELQKFSKQTSLKFAFRFSEQLA